MQVFGSDFFHRQLKRCDGLLGSVAGADGLEGSPESARGRPSALTSPMETCERRVWTRDRLSGNRSVSHFPLPLWLFFKTTVTHSFIQLRAAGRRAETEPNLGPASLLPSHSFLHGHSEKSSEPAKEQSEQPGGRSRQDSPLLPQLHQGKRQHTHACSFWGVCHSLSMTSSAQAYPPFFW